MDTTLHWWTLLCGVALVNVAAWLATAATVRRTALHGTDRWLPAWPGFAKRELVSAEPAIPIGPSFKGRCQVV